MSADPIADWFAGPVPVPSSADLEALAVEAAANDPAGSSMSWRFASPEERERHLEAAAQFRNGLPGSLGRAGFTTELEYLKAVLPPESLKFYLTPSELVRLEAERNEPTPLHPPTGETHWRTLADIPDDPPRDLIFGMLEPDGPTLAYAAPGTGKGMTGAWLAVEAQRAGMHPLIFDAERRPREWSRRVGGLGGDRSRVAYLEPPDLGPKLAGRPLWESMAAIGRVAKAVGVDLLIIDSVLPAVGLGEERLRSDAQVPYLWVAALDALGIPSLSFGHPPKGQPEGEPFGSFAWVAAMRLTWLGTKAEGEGHRVRWRPKKRNERGHIAGILLTVAYGDDGRPCGVERIDDEEGTRDWILAALVHGPRGVSDLADELAGEFEDPPAGEIDRIKERIGRTLRRMAREGWVERLGGAGGRNVRWALRLSENRP